MIFTAILLLGFLSINYAKGSSYYLGFFQNKNGGSPSLYLTNTKELDVFYSIEAPGVGYSYSGTITSSGSAIVNLPTSVLCSSYNDQNKGIYLRTNSSDIIAIGQNMNSRNGDSFLVLSNMKLCNFTEYVYYGVSMPSTSYDSVVLIVGTEDNTVIDLTVTQSVYVKTGFARSYLTPGRQRSFVINRLQTVYIGSSSDLTGTRVAATKPLSMFSGHECGYIPSGYSYCEQLVEQIPATMYWGKVYYTVQFTISTYYTIKVLAAYDSTSVYMYCNNVRTSYSINAGKFIAVRKQGYCAVHSNKEVLVAQISHGHTTSYSNGWSSYTRYTSNDPMLTLVPATVHYSNEINLSTVQSSSYTNYISIVVLAEYYQPDMIYLMANGVNNSLKSKTWTAIRYNSKIEAYGTYISVSKGAVKVAHINTAASASMAVVVYGSNSAPSYGHPGGFNIPEHFPVITKHPSSQTVTLFTNNQTHSFTCEADRASSYLWRRLDKDMPSTVTGVNTNILTFGNLQLEDAGEYQCVAICEFTGSNFSEHAMLTFKVLPPRIITHPTDTSAAAPFSGVFTCSAGGYGHRNITWYRKHVSNELLPEKCTTSQVSSPDITTSTLIVPNVTKENNGKYYCVVWANNKLATRSKSATLYASTSPLKPVVLTSPSIQLTINNYNLSMECIPERDGFSYMWEKRNDNFTSRAQGIYSSQLNIFNVTPEDSGDYRCIMSNSTGVIASNYKTITIEVMLPDITIEPETFVEAETCGESVLKCTASGFGNVKVAWKRLHDELPETTEISTTESLNQRVSIMKITKVAWYHKGDYYCVAKNDVGEVNSSFVHINVTVPCPKMVRPPIPVAVRPGRTAIFNCLAWSFGGLVYEWKRNHTSMIPQNSVTSFKKWSSVDDSSFSSISYELRIPEVNTSYEDYYCCVATNACGNNIRCAWLEVDTRPIITTQPSSAVIRKNDENVHTIECIATGMGPILYKWEKYESSSNSWIKPSQRVVNITSPKLIFSVITEEDEGVYHCVVTNDDGSVISDSATITVYGKPNISDISNDTMSVEGNKVKLSCNATNDPDAVHPLQVYWYNSDGDQVISDGEHVLVYNSIGPGSDQAQSVILFDHVNRTDDGTYTCRAYNDPNSTADKNTSLTVEYAPIITIDPLQSPYTVSVGTRLLLYCRADGLPTPTVQWFSGRSEVNDIAQLFQQLYLVPTNSPGTRVYTCKGINYAGSIKQSAEKSIIVIVEAINCPPLSDPSNGQVYVIQNGKIVFFNCNDGYSTVGSSISYCVGGKWSFPPPECEKSS